MSIDCGPNRARGRTSVLFALLVVVLAAGVFVFSRSDSRPAPRTAPPEESSPPGFDGGREPASGGAGGPEPAAAEPPPQRREASPEDPHEARFRGTGSLRGFVDVFGDHPFPREWRLVLEPSRLMAGSEAAEERVVEFTDGRQDFSVQGLHLGGYDVRAEAEGLNAQSLAILLERRSPDVYIVLRMLPAGFVDGRVVDRRGIAAAAVPLTLFELPADAEAEVRGALTDDLGRFRFDGVVDGAYELLVGTPEAPIVKARRTLRVTAPGMTVPEIELPPLATVTVLVTDTDERMVPDARLLGSGSPFGTFEGVTNGYGRFTAKWVPFGRWRIRVECEGYRGRRIAVDVADDLTVPLLVHPDS